MSHQIIININETSTIIDDDYIIQATSVVTNKTKFNFDDMIAATTEFILDDSTGIFNPDNSNSIFYQDDWYNQQVSIYSNDILVWNGLLKKLKYSGKTKTLTVKTKNYIQEIIDKECSLIRGTGSSENITPAQIILEVLTDWVGLPESGINRIGFNQAISYQGSINAYVELRLGQENSTSSSEVILALCRMTGAYIYAEDNIVNYFQPTPYDGELGEEIKASDIKEKSFMVEYDDKEIVNYSSVFTKGVNNPTSVFLKNSKEYRFLVTITTTSGSAIGTVTYFYPTDTSGLPDNAADYLKKGYLINNGDAVTPSVPPYSTIEDFDIDNNTITFSENATQTGSSDFTVSALEPVNDTYLGNYVFESFAKYGLKSYKLVKNTPSSDTDLIASHKILFKGFNDSDNVIDLKTKLNTSMKKYCNFTLDYNKNFIKLNDQLDLTFDFFVREPVRVITKKLDSLKRKIDVKCEFINSPYEYYQRDTTIPENFPIFSFFYDVNKIVTIWNKQLTEINYYRLYFGPDEFFDGIATEGLSPLIENSPTENTNNQLYKLLSGCSEYKYFLKATGIDSSENESDDSNIFHPVNIANVSTYEKRYKVTGEMWTGLIATSNLNGDENGYLPPAPMTYYDELDYDEGTYSYVGAYETVIIGSDKGFNSITWKASDFNSAIAIQYREYDINSGTFGAWNTLKNETNRYFEFNLSGENAVQFRIYLSDTTTKLFLQNIIEVD